MEDEETKKQRRGGWRTGKELCDDVFNVVARELPKKIEVWAIAEHGRVQFAFISIL